MFLNLLNSFKTGIYAVTRVAEGSYVNGDYVPGSTTNINIDMVVQPLSGSELQSLPEGQHAENVRKVYTNTILYTRSANNDPDKITISGETWEVISESDFGGVPSMNHYKYRIAKVTIP